MSNRSYDREEIYDIQDSAGELTQFAYAAMFDFDIENEPKRNEFLTEPQNYMIFSAGFKNMLKKCGCKSDDEKGMMAFIRAEARKRGMELPAATTISFNNWMTDKINPQGNPTSRENMYKFCFALGLDVNETKKFFSEVYLDRPFDCRQITEAVYLYCLANDLTYSKAEELIKKTELPDSGKMIDETRLINEDIRNMSDEEEFLEYVKTNAASFSTKNVTGRNKARELMNSAYEICEKESDNLVLTTILGMDLKNLAKEKINIKKSGKFLDVVKFNFPDNERISQVLNPDKEASYFTIRKVLILLKFFVFFAEKKRKEYCSELLADFWLETNDMLLECGFGPLYGRNPYDWLFLHCASCCHDADSEDDGDLLQPLDEFKDIMAAMVYSDN